LLTRLGLTERFDQDPAVVLAALRGPGEGLTREYLFVLSELSFYHAAKSNKPEYFLASAVYAWAFVLGRTDEARVDPIDPRLRLATNLYNLGLAQGLEVGDEATVVLEPGPRRLPFGQIEISVDEKMLLWSSYRMTRFVSLGEFKVRGFLNRYRQAGIGAPLAAELTPLGTGPEAEEARKRIPARLKVPVTALLRIEDVSTGIAIHPSAIRLAVRLSSDRHHANPSAIPKEDRAFTLAPASLLRFLVECRLHRVRLPFTPECWAQKKCVPCRAVYDGYKTAAPGVAHAGTPQGTHSVFPITMEHRLYFLPLSGHLHTPAIFPTAAADVNAVRFSPILLESSPRR
jgi:hypothetical protein